MTDRKEDRELADKTKQLSRTHAPADRLRQPPRIWLKRVQGPQKWLQGLSREADRHTRYIAGVKDEGLDRLVSLVRDPLMDTAKAQWVADQLLDAGENGVLLPANIVLDAYARGKLRYYLNRHGTNTALVLALSCTCVHMLKLGIGRCCQHRPALNRIVRLVMDVAFPTALFGPLLAARLLL